MGEAVNSKLSGVDPEAMKPGRLAKMAGETAFQGALMTGIMEAPCVAAIASLSAAGRKPFEQATGLKGTERGFRQSVIETAKKVQPPPPPVGTTFDFEAIDPKTGEEFRDYIHAGSEEEAGSIIRSNGLVPTKLKKSKRQPVQGESDAISQPSTTESNGDRGTQPEPTVRQEPGATEDVTQAASRLRQDENQGAAGTQETPEAPQEETQSIPADSTADAGVETTPIPAEAPPTPETPVEPGEPTGESVGTKNAATDKMASRAGLPERVPPEREHQTEWQVQADDILHNEPGAGDRLVVKSLGDPKWVPTPVENAVLRRHLQNLRQEGLDKGDNRSRYYDAIQAARRGGSEAGRALVARVPVFDENGVFDTDAAAEHMQRTAKRPPTDEELQQFEEWHARSMKVQSDAHQEAMAAQQTEYEGKISDLIKQHVGEIESLKKTQPPPQPSADPSAGESPKPKPIKPKSASKRPKDVQERISTAWDRVHAARQGVVEAHKRALDPTKLSADVTGGLVTFGKEVLPAYLDLIKAYMDVGASHLYGVLQAMKGDLSEEEYSREKGMVVSAFHSLRDSGDLPPPDRLDPADRKEVSDYARQAAKSILESGEVPLPAGKEPTKAEIDTLVSKVHEVMQDAVPGITEQQTKEALSQFEQQTIPSQDPLKKFLAAEHYVFAPQGSAWPFATGIGIPCHRPGPRSCHTA